MYYALSILEWGKRWNCDKTVQKVYLDPVPAFQTVKKCFRRILQGDFYLNAPSWSGRTLGVDEDSMPPIMENKRKTSMEEMAKNLKIHISDASRSSNNTRMPHSLM